MIIYNTTIIGMGDNAQDFAVEKMFITYSRQMPDNLSKYCYYTEFHHFNEDMRAGDVLQINKSFYEITAVGNVVNENMKNYGHACFKFNGKTKAELPSTIHLEAKAFPNLEVGSKIQIIKQQLNSSTTELLTSNLMENASYTDFFESNFDKFKITKLSIYLKELVYQTKENINDIFANAVLSKSYIYQILNGDRIPSRDKLIIFCLYVNANLKTVNKALKLAQKSELYIRNGRDSIIMHGIIHNKTLDEINVLLLKNDFEILK